MELTSKEILVTEEGYKKLEEKLKYLKGTRTVEVAERLKIAKEYGDLSENSEYDDAKDEQAQLGAKIIELENTLKMAKIVADDAIDTKKIGVGTTVKLYDYEFDEEVEYTVVGATEVDLKNGKISNASPVGAALIGKTKGQEVEVETPNGVCKYKVLEISRK